jgi:hypothetical protein
MKRPFIRFGRMACVKGLAVTGVRYLEGREDTTGEDSMVRTPWCELHGANDLCVAGATRLCSSHAVHEPSGSTPGRHGIELFYVFKTIPAGVQAEEADLKVADAMHAAWLRFSESGDPNGKGFPEWPAFSTANDTHFEFGDRLGTGQHLMSDECDLFDEISISRIRGAGIPGE